MKSSVSVLQVVVRCCLPTGILVGVIVEVLSSSHVLGNVTSADCLVHSILLEWPREFGLYFLSSAAIACLASACHGLVYGELLIDGWKVAPLALPEKRFSSTMKRVYLVALIPLLLIAGYFAATILMTELLNRPGAINHGC